MMMWLRGTKRRIRSFGFITRMDEGIDVYVSRFLKKVERRKVTMITIFSICNTQV